MAKINGKWVYSQDQEGFIPGVDEYGDTTVDVKYKGLTWNIPISDVYKENEIWYEGPMKCPNCKKRKEIVGVGDEPVLCNKCRNEFEVWKWAASTPEVDIKRTRIKGQKS